MLVLVFVVLVMLAGSGAGIKRPVVGLSWEEGEDEEEVYFGAASATWSR